MSTAPARVFLSHTTTDEPIARALSAAIEDLFGPGTVSVEFSTRKEGPGRIRSGEPWFDWIQAQVRESALSLVLVTPASIAKPWIYWEAGAVFGCSMATGGDIRRRVRPILYQLDTDQTPTTFERLQTLRGDKEPDVRQLLSDLLDDFTAHIPPADVFSAGQRLQQVLDRYLAQVAAALRTAPLQPSEATVQEWCLRLDQLRQGDRSSEVQHLHHWLNITFGVPDDQPFPLDLRLHRRLGEMYLSAGRYPQAVAQFRLALQLVPRDILVLRSLGQALLGQGDDGAVRQVLDQIAGLDPDAFSANVECAALKGRWLRERGNLTDARDVFAEALRSNPESYYLADVLGQTQLELKDLPGARETYGKVLSWLSDAREYNIWTEATATTAALVLDEHEQVLDRLRSIAGMNPSVADRFAVLKGLDLVRGALGLPDTLTAVWEAAMDGGSSARTAGRRPGTTAQIAPPAG